MKTVIAAAVLTLVAAGAGAWTAAPAHAEGGDQRPCATRGEYRNVHRGQTPQRVARIIDTAGRREASGRVYPICQRFTGLPHRRYVYVAYAGGHAVLKEWAVTV